MPLATRRLIYSLFAALGFIMMVPLSIAMRRFQAALASVDPTNVESILDPALTDFSQSSVLLFLLGLLLASGFLYLVVSTGYPKGWRPQENGSPRCSRCNGEVRFGVGLCPACEQRQTW